MILYYTHSYEDKQGESRRLLIKAIASYIGNKKKAEQLAASIRPKDKLGKPEIEDFDEFSISHSERTWAVLIGKNECGLDIQYPKETCFLEVANRFFNKVDAEAVRIKGPSEFFRIWTRREALIKAIGVSVTLSNMPSVLEEEVVLDGHIYNLREIDIPAEEQTGEQSNLHAAVCIKGHMENVKIHELQNSKKMQKKKQEKMQKKKQGKMQKQKTAMEAAFAYLANRMRTISDTRNHLQQKGYPDDEISETINELRELRYLDDYYYALRYFEYNHSKHRGSLRAIRELEEKGISDEIIRNAREDYFYENKIDEYAEALELARKEIFYLSEDGRGCIIKRKIDDKLVAKIGRKLERNGFCTEHIYRVIYEIRNRNDENI